ICALVPVNSFLGAGFASEQPVTSRARVMAARNRIGGTAYVVWPNDGGGTPSRGSTRASRPPVGGAPRRPAPAPVPGRRRRLRARWLRGADGGGDHARGGDVESD